MDEPFIHPDSGNRWQRWARSNLWWHRRRHHNVQKRLDTTGLPVTVCWDCHMSWSPLWGTSDTIVRYHPKNQT